MWISSKWDFENMNSVKNEILKMWILWKMRLWSCEFCEKWDFENVNSVKSEVFKMWILGEIEDFSPCVKWDNFKLVFEQGEGLLLSQVPSHGTCVEVDLKKNSASAALFPRSQQSLPGRRHLISAAKFSPSFTKVWQESFDSWARESRQKTCLHFRSVRVSTTIITLELKLGWRAGKWSLAKQESGKSQEFAL